MWGRGGTERMEIFAGAGKPSAFPTKRRQPQDQRPAAGPHKPLRRISLGRTGGHVHGRKHCYTERVGVTES